MRKKSLVAAMMQFPHAVKLLRDPTRGGIASTLNEWAATLHKAIEIDEEAVPVSPQVRAACDILGIDPFYAANEGKLLTIVSSDHAEQVLSIMRRHPLGRNSAIIGSVTGIPRPLVYARTFIGGKRIIGMIDGEQLPRIC